MLGLFRRALVTALTVGATCCLMLTAADAAAARTTGHHHRASVRAARRALVAYLKHSDALELRAPSRRFDLLSSGSAVASSGSYNWSGYEDTSPTTGDFTEVNAAWTVPAVTCTQEDQIASDWVGIDGATDGTVEQDGTTGWCFEGSAYYFTWWEMYPTNAEQNVGTTVQPGDSITSVVTRTGQSYKLSVTDSTSPSNSFSTTQTCSSGCNDTSVEWIGERPSFNIGIAPFVDQHTWTATTAQQEQTGISGRKPIASGPNPTAITMVDATDSYALSTPSALSGTKFSDVWDNSW